MKGPHPMLSIMGILAALVILSLVGLVISNLYGDPSDPVELMEVLKNRSDSVESAKMLYESSFLSSSDLNMEIEHTILDDKVKVLASVSAFGSTLTTATYKHGNISVSCSEGGYYQDRGISCSYGVGGDVPALSDLTPETSTLLGNSTVTKEKVIGRTCYNFHMNVTVSELEDLSGESYYYLDSDTIIEYDLCLDKKTGTLSRLLASSTTVSALSGREKSTELINITLLEYTDEVSDEDVEFPVPFVLRDVQCTPGELEYTIMYLKHLENFEQGIGRLYTPVGQNSDTGSKTVEGPVDLGQVDRVSLDVPGSEDDNYLYYDFDVCVDGHCESDSCRPFSRTISIGY